MLRLPVEIKGVRVSGVLVGGVVHVPDLAPEIVDSRCFAYLNMLQSVGGSSFDQSKIPNSYEARANDYHEEVMSSVASYHKKLILPDLNEVPVFVCSYGYSVYEYTGEPSYAQQNYSGNAYVWKNYSNNVYTDEHDHVEQSNDELLDDEKHFRMKRNKILCPTKSWGRGVKKGIDNGYVIVIKRSKTKEVWLHCSCSEETKSIATQRITGSKKINFPFLLFGFYDGTRNAWRLEVMNPEHNHGPAQHMEGYAYARRLSQNEYQLVEQLSVQDMKSGKIWKTIMAQNPDSKCVTKDIHNTLQKINATRIDPKTCPIQKLEHLLIEKQFIYYTHQDSSTNVIEDIFFIHLHVLFIDATYKTNMYNLPFIKVVGMTSTNQTFCSVGYFLSKEGEANFTWFLEMLRAMLDECMEPRVILIDKDV